MWVENKPEEIKIETWQARPPYAGSTLKRHVEDISEFHLSHSPRECRETEAHIHQLLSLPHWGLVWRLLAMQQFSAEGSHQG